MKTKTSIFIAFILIVLFATTAFAGVGSLIKGVGSWLLESGLLWAVGLFLSIGVVAYYADWVSQLFITVGELFVVFGTSFTDKKLTKEEVQNIKDAFTKMKATFKARPKKNG